MCEAVEVIKILQQVLILTSLCQHVLITQNICFFLYNHLEIIEYLRKISVAPYYQLRAGKHINRPC